MSFFKFNKKTKTEDLKLSDYDQIWTKFCFLDETGNLNNPTDPFFTVGILKLSQPYYLLNKLQYERSKRNFHDEMKFNKLSKRNIDFAKFAIGAFFDARSVYFYSYSVDKEGAYFKREFSGDPWQAYQKITVRLLKDVALAPKEILILLADHVTVPKNIRFEVDVKKEVNSSLKRLALAGVCRIDSRSNDLLQLVDIIIGAISYDLKIATGAIMGGCVYKTDLVKYLKQNLGASEFMHGFRNRICNIFVDKDMRSRLPFKTNEKGPSS